MKMMSWVQIGSYVDITGTDLYPLTMEVIMNNLIPMNKEGLLVNKDREVMVDSRYVAEVFEKEHKQVMRDIRVLTEKLGVLSEDIGRYKFVPSSYKNIQGKKQPCYLLNRNAFTLLVMGYTTPKALAFKVWYINRFDEMESLLQSMLALRACLLYTSPSPRD